MTLIDDFERTIGKPVRLLSTSDLINLLRDGSIIKKYFTSIENSIILLDTIEKINEDPEVRCTVYTIRESLELREAWILIDTLFKKFRHGEISREELSKTISDYTKSSNIILALLTYECVLSVLVDINLSKDQQHIKDLVEKSKDIFNKLTVNIAVSYQMQTALADLLYTLNADNFDRYGEEIDLKWLDKIVSKFNEFQEEIYQLDESEYKFGGYQTGKLLPEDLGLIDITKLKEE